jgi:isopentenyldiphosphate isomerase
MEEIVDLVDTADRIVGRAPRPEVRRLNLLHRGVGILCRNPRGEVYVHRRTPTKDVFPHLYDMFVGGAVASGETYLQAATREIAEELGVTGVPLEFLFAHLYQGPHNRAWVHVFQV